MKTHHLFWQIDAKGWLQCPDPSILRHTPSPNCDHRPLGVAIDLLLIHFISLPPFEYGGPYIRQLFTNQLNPNEHPYFQEIAHLHVSSHVVIYRDGAVEQFVSFLQKAWHAGASEFKGRTHCNNFSIGIELEGCEFEEFTDVQYQRLSQLTQVLCDHYPLKAMTGHENVAPGRKNDPGPFFDWEEYEKLIHHRLKFSSS